MSGDWGLKTFNTDGSEQFEFSARMGKVIGIHDTLYKDGSLDAPALLEGTPFYFAPIDDGKDGGILDVAFSGKTMSWTYPDSKNKNGSLIIFGVY